MAPRRPPGARISPQKHEDSDHEMDEKAHEHFSEDRKEMSTKIKNVFGKQIMGGPFAKAPSSYEGVLYSSRVVVARPTTAHDEDHFESGSDDEAVTRVAIEVDQERLQSTQGGLENTADDVSSADEEEPADMTQRQQLAVTLRNYCKREGNVKHLLDEGAVVALCGLAGLEDDRIRCAVAVALSNLTKRGDYIDALLKAGVMVAVLQLATGLPQATTQRNRAIARRKEYGMADPAPGSVERRKETAGLRVALHCARTLANMSFCKGGEAAMVADGVVPACRLTLAHGPKSAAASCVQALYNLTTVHEPYDGLDTVVKAACSLPVTDWLDARRIAAACCCNASVFFPMRARLIEAGALVTLKAVADDDSPDNWPFKLFRVADAVANAMHNLAAARACRSDLVSRGTVPILCMLADYCDPSRLTAVAQTLAKLSRDVGSRDRILRDGGLECARDVALRGHALPSATRPLAEALLNLSRRRGAVERICERGYAVDADAVAYTKSAMTEAAPIEDVEVYCTGVVAADVLVLLSLTSDAKTRLGWARALAQILSDTVSHSSFIVKGGVLKPVIELLKELVENGADSEHAEGASSAFVEALALTCYYVSKGGEAEHAMDQGIGDALVALPACLEVAMKCHGNEDPVRRDRAKLRGGITGPPLDDEDPISERVLGVVAEALDNLAAQASPPAMNLLVQAGMLPCLTQLLRGDALAVQATCATALANAAFAKDAIFAAFVEGGDASPLTSFADALRRHIFEPDPETDPTSDEYLGAEIVGACDAALVGGCCAALASLSYDATARHQMQKAGALRAVLEICKTCPVNTTSTSVITTRCATTLCNVSSDEDSERRLQLVQDGIVGALGRLSESYSEDMQNDIARCFCNLAHAPHTPQALVDHGAVQILMLVGTMRASAVTTRRCVAQALWNICTPATLEALINTTLDPKEEDDTKKRKPDTAAMAFAHAFGLLAAQDDEQTLELVAALFAATASTKHGRQMLVLAKNQVLKGAYTLLRSKTRSTRLTAGLAACNLLRDAATANEACRTGALHVVRVLSVQGDDTASLACCGCLAALCDGDESLIATLARDGAAPVPVHLALTHDVLVARAAVRTIACLAIHEQLRGPLVRAGAPTALVGACLRDAADRDANADAVARGMLYLSASPELIPAMVAQRAVAGLSVLGRHVARRRANNDVNASARLQDVPRAVVACLRRLAADSSVHDRLVSDGGAAAVCGLVVGPGNDVEHVARDAAACLCSVARTETLAAALGRDRAGAALLALSSQDSIKTDTQGQWRVLRALLDLARFDEAQRGPLADQGVVTCVESLNGTACTQARQCAAACLCHISFHKPSRARMVADGAVDALVRAAEDTKANETTKHWCAVALANLSAETDVSAGDVAALLNVTFAEVTNATPAAEEPLSPSGTLTRKMTTRVKAVLHGVGEASAATSELLHQPGNLVDESPSSPNWSTLSGEGHAAFVAATLAQAPAADHDALPLRASTGVAEAARVTSAVTGVDPPRVVDDFVTCAALEDSVPLEDFAADDVLQVGFPKLQDAPSLQPPAE